MPRYRTGPPHTRQELENLLAYYTRRVETTTCADRRARAMRARARIIDELTDLDARTLDTAAPLRRSP